MLDDNKYFRFPAGLKITLTIKLTDMPTKKKLLNHCALPDSLRKKEKVHMKCSIMITEPR
jgi:hypothetical protein